MSNQTDNVTTDDIYNFILFATIHKDNGKIEGHRVVLTDEQQNAIQEIVKANNVRVLEEPQFELEVTLT